MDDRYCLDTGLNDFFLLLASNSSNIRSNVAVQIGEISAKCQEHLCAVLNKLLPYIKHENTDTRISAAYVLEQIGKNTDLWSPNAREYEKPNNLISLEQLDLLEIVNIGTRLDNIDIIELEEGEIHPSVHLTKINNHFRKLLLTDEEEGTKGEITHNLMDRKYLKRGHSDDRALKEQNKNIIYTTTKEEDKVVDEDNSWPWMDLCNDLLQCLWHPDCEIRHGAATSLREIIKSQVTVMVDKRTTHFNECHSLFMDVVIGRLICTIALDRYICFINDERVVPVIESCAQCLGLMTAHLSDNAAIKATEHLLVLLAHDDMTVQYGALLGLKYVLESRLDSLHNLSTIVCEPIFLHTKDSPDNFRCAAAVAALMPLFSRGYLRDQIETLRNDLWTMLVVRADYTFPRGFRYTMDVLRLLEKLYEDDKYEQRPLPHNMPVTMNRLHWYYYAKDEAIRLSALRTCAAIVRYYSYYLGEFSMNKMLTQLYQRVLVDQSPRVIEEVEGLWQSIIEQVGPRRLVQYCSWSWMEWMELAMQPATVEYSPDCLQMPNNEHHAQRMSLVFFIGGTESDLIGRADSARLAACSCLAAVCASLSKVPCMVRSIVESLLSHLHTSKGLQRFVAASVMSQWTVSAACKQARAALLNGLREELMRDIDILTIYDEVLPLFDEMMTRCQRLVVVCRQGDIKVSDLIDPDGTDITNKSKLTHCSNLVNNQLVENRLRSTNVDVEIFESARTSVEDFIAADESFDRLVRVPKIRAMMNWQWEPLHLDLITHFLEEVLVKDERLWLKGQASYALAELDV